MVAYLHAAVFYVGRQARSTRVFRGAVYLNAVLLGIRGRIGKPAERWRVAGLSTSAQGAW